MFTHKQVWAAIDALAHENNLSASGLARSAGLDPTSFNKSKRFNTDGRERWPSTESLAKIAVATNTSMEVFWRLIVNDKREFAHRLTGLLEGMEGDLPPVYQLPPPIPLLGSAEAGKGGYFDDSGFPIGEGWDEIRLPVGGEDGVFALEISGDSMLPAYRDGDRIIVSKESVPRRGDRVVVKTVEGEVTAKVLARKTAKTIELHAINPEHENRQFSLSEIDWMYRILWASQ